MRLYTCTGAPSPRRVSLMIAEKGMSVDNVEVDLKSGLHLTEDFAMISPQCTVPVLELDSGETIWEVTAIRRYLEDLQPDPHLLGRNPLERARVEMWVRWVENQGLSAVAEAFRNSARGMKDHALPGRRPIAQITELAERGEVRYQHFLADLEKRLAKSSFVAGDDYSAADIDALVAVDFATRAIHTEPPLELESLQAWYRTVNERIQVRGGV